MTSDYKKGQKNTFSTQPSNCDDLGGSVPLASPDRTILSTVKAGDCLKVDLVQDKGMQLPGVLVDGKTLGTIPTAHFPELINCLKAGNKFHAKVERIQGGACDVVLGGGACP